MRDRTTRKMLEEKVAYLSQRLGVEFFIDHYSPGGNPYTYRLAEKRGSGGKDVTPYRMTADQFRAYLNGMIDCLDSYATAGV